MPSLIFQEEDFESFLEAMARSDAYGRGDIRDDGFKIMNTGNREG
jgi:hypothetical protein